MVFELIEIKLKFSNFVIKYSKSQFYIKASVLYTNAIKTEDEKNYF